MVNCCAIEGRRFIELVSLHRVNFILCGCQVILHCYSKQFYLYYDANIHTNIKVPNFIIQGGDISGNNGVGGESIYGGYFDDESFEVNHTIASIFIHVIVRHFFIPVLSSPCLGATQQVISTEHGEQGPKYQRISIFHKYC